MQGDLLDTGRVEGGLVDAVVNHFGCYASIDRGRVEVGTLLFGNGLTSKIFG
jgi:hypothetical protein